jgi:hypothetical protein
MHKPFARSILKAAWSLRCSAAARSLSADKFEIGA